MEIWSNANPKTQNSNVHISIPAATKTRKVWLRIGTLFDGENVRLLRNAHVVYDAESILYVANEKDPPPLQLIGQGQSFPDLDLPEFTLLPGLIEAHAHLFLEGGEIRPEKRAANLKRSHANVLEAAGARLEKLVRLGIVGVRDAGDNMGIGLSLSKRYLSAREILIAYVDSPGAAINHRGEYGSFMAEALENFRSPRECVLSRLNEGAARIKLIASDVIDFRAGVVARKPQMTSDEIAGFTAAAKELGMQTFAHATGDRGIENAVEGGDELGHGERSVAVGTLDMAIWDAVAKIAGKPLFRLLAERHGREASPRVFVYAAGGYYYPGKDLDALRREMRGYLDRGYTVVKMKIGGALLAEDRQRIETVLTEIDGRGQLAVDANGRFDLETAIAYAKVLREYPLFWYEEAGDPLDFQLQAALADFYPGPMATGENIFSHQDARNLLRYGGMRPDRDWLQFDCALSYGLCEYQRTLEVLTVHGWSARRCIPHGGHQMSLNIAAGLGLGGNESYPDLFQPYGGFPDGVSVEDGYVDMPELPGIGFEGKTDLYAEMRALSA